jgi:hypothetical protein
VVAVKVKHAREGRREGRGLRRSFLLSLTGNFTYGASVISCSQEADYFVRVLPWLLGSLGTMVEDCIIFACSSASTRPRGSRSSLAGRCDVVYTAGDGCISKKRQLKPRRWDDGGI